MATFRAENVGLLFALTGMGFEPVPGVQGRVFHPTLKGRSAKRAFSAAWFQAVRLSIQMDLWYETPNGCGCCYTAHPFG